MYLGGTYDGENAYLEVHDDGPGMDEAHLKKIQPAFAMEFPGRTTVSFGTEKW